MFKRIPKISVLLLTGAFIVISCKNDPASLNDDEPPQIPAAESMKMDFSAFENNQNQKADVTRQSGNNFSQAVVRVFVIKTVTDINLAIPRALLEAASNAEAEFNDDGEWVWSFSKTTGSDTYEVRLVASRASEDGVGWQFFVTNSSLNIDNKLFFSGSANAEGTEGTWIYYNLLNSEEEEAVSKITWRVNGEEDVTLRLEVISDHTNHAGDYVEYTFDGTVKNAVYFNADKGETTEIQWNIETNEGYIIAPGYNNGEKACWDSNFQDVACS